MSSPHDATLAQYEAAAALRDEGDTWYELTLIVSGASELSTRAIANVRRLGEESLGGRYHLSIVDLHEAPASVLSSQVLAAPTLVKNRPLPVGKFVGDLSRTDIVLRALGLPPRGVSGAAD
ncbi:MAG: circadian clock protein KaiB [Actinomycetota bacterium]|nr:circadian clock protein KaiB [Actinomycetota bacterium]